jgi:hypothetical protein
MQVLIGKIRKQVGKDPVGEVSFWLGRPAPKHVEPSSRRTFQQRRPEYRLPNTRRAVHDQQGESRRRAIEEAFAGGEVGIPSEKLRVHGRSNLRSCGRRALAA